ncbi:hypothetical protein [Sporocytophaga myxococcoides]|uniref:hypothetical protein n=1 Tax=Sporocytophaga myxococcoides TaxID=153721 RepID=UPI00049219BC|nr:hypothetical protein [Sporocytophaga myxococcoides]
MKKDFIIILFLFFIPALSFAQENIINRAFLGVNGNYFVPIFGFQRENYKSGPGISFSYLSKKLPVFKQLPYSLRIGANVGVSGQGSRDFNLTAHDSLRSVQRFYNTFSYFTLLGRFTFEKNKIFKPYLELSFGLGNFSSHESISRNLNPSFYSKPRGNYQESMSVFGISAGYLIQVTEWFMIDAKITYYQGTKKTAFTDLDHFSYSTPYYYHTKREAVPSLISAQLGLLFRVPRPSISMSPPEPTERPSRLTPVIKPIKPKENKNGELAPGNESTPQKPKETKTFYGPKKRH